MSPHDELLHLLALDAECQAQRDQVEAQQVHFEYQQIKIAAKHAEIKARLVNLGASPDRSGYESAPMSRGVSVDARDMIPCRRNLSQQSAPAMMRHFSQSAPAGHLSQTLGMMRNLSQSAPVGMPLQLPTRPPPALRHDSLSDRWIDYIPEADFGEHPQDYLRRTEFSTDEDVLGGIEMLHVNSNSSLLTETTFDDGSLTETTVDDGSHERYPPATESSRSKQQLQKQIQHAARTLMPKEGAVAMIRVPSTSGAEDRVLAPIPKAPYQRPQHERVHCTKCSDCPEGFRGEHELRRHDDRQHKCRVKKFVCRQPTDLQEGDPTPIFPLSKCKACSVQQKQYNIYYNAAAHLRRAHFRPKRPRRKSKMQDKDHRSGKAAGDWPTMEQLKKWWVVVEVDVESGEQPDDDKSEDEHVVQSISPDMGCESQSHFDTFVWLNDGSPYFSHFPPDQEIGPEMVSFVNA